MKTKLCCILSVVICAMRVTAGQLTAFATLPAGSTPEAGLVVGKTGDFYGTLYSSATAPGGAIFDLTASGYLFPLIPLNPLIGANPTAPLISDHAGNLYGTASAGGPRGLGTIFEWTTGGTFTRVVAFNGTNGSRPVAPVLLNNGTLFGVTSAGGSNNFGTFFAVSNGDLTNLATFNANSGVNPETGLVPGPNNKLYGTTEAGGRGGSGTIYSINGFGALQSFVSLSGTNAGTAGTLTEGPDGNLYGVTTGIGAGTIFEVTKSGQLITVHQFRGPDGATPNGPLLAARDGNLYGTTQTQGTNGFGTIFRLTPGPTASFNLLASFDGTNGAYPQGGLVQGADGNFYGTSLGLGGAGAVFEYGAIAPGILKAPVSVIWSANHTAIFSVAAVGSLPLTYQWSFNDAPIPGATNSAIEISPETFQNIGLYSVTVSNAYGETNAQAMLQGALPTITMDATPATVTNSAITVAGTAASAFGVLAVDVSLNGTITAANIISTNISRTNWSATLTLAPGSNLVQAYSIDSLHDSARPASANIFYRAPGTLTWETNGSGKISASENTNGLLAIGRPITFLATPSPGNLFAGWIVTSDEATTNSVANPLTGLMPSNLVVEADFVPNYFPPLAGTYAGLFFNQEFVAPQIAGMIRSSVGPHGGVSGQVAVGGATYSFSGGFNGAGTANLMARAANGASLRLDLILPPNSATMSGKVQSVNGPTWAMLLTAGRASTVRETNHFTMLLPPSGDDPAIPPGDGYAAAATRNGIVTLSGSTADGFAFSETAPVVGIDESEPIVANVPNFPLYASFANGNGILLGWLDLSSGAPQGTVWEVREPSSVGANYREGFTNVITVQSSLWTNSAPVLLTNLTISEGGLSAPLEFTVTVNQNKIIKTGGATNSLSGTINPANGVFHVTFGNGSGKAVTHGVGAILQNSQAAGGFFLGPSSDGAIISP